MNNNTLSTKYFLRKIVLSLADEVHTVKANSTFRKEEVEFRYTSPEYVY